MREMSIHGCGWISSHISQLQIKFLIVSFKTLLALTSN